MVLVVSGAGYAVFRSVARERHVARLQSDFVAAVSHEFRTPLAAVRHLADLLETGAPESAQRTEYSAAIGREARRLQALVENLLDFGRIEEGRRYDLSSTDVVALTRQVAEECSDRAAGSGYAIRVSGPDEAVTVRVDREAVALALRNLIDNAIKYSPGAGLVDVRVAGGPETVAIAVEDYGVGLPAEERASVFGTFVRGSAARSLMVKGTGIGLAMADRIVRAHGGSILVESSPGHGSTFTITLPRTNG
jgi:two-component system phosphate regulon sensor histidine kinase PhoR